MDISISSLSLEVPPNQLEPLPAEMGPSQEAEQPTGQAVELPGPEQWQEPVDFIAMLSLVLEHDVPQLEMEPSTGIDPHSWQQRNMYVSYSLGEGASSFLELHAMREDVSLEGRLFRKGGRVALKRSFVERFDDDVGVSPQQYDFIKRELRVFCHPRLRSHENICNLLFVGWEEYTPAPVLGLELAEYGTLKDLLFDADLSAHGSLGTHLVLDLALGLQALHDVGIVHGDVKTGNILVFAHPRRNIVAKLADFSDSACLAENGGTWAPLGGTHSWRAPECYGDVEYDLKKTDVYSFGLCALAILAQGIWYSNANNAGLGDCFLVRIKELNGKTKGEAQRTVTSWKRDPDDLVLRWGLEWAEAFAVGDAISKRNAMFTVSAALWREPERRGTMGIIIAGQFELLGSIDERER
jgi:serine/threonine protein kinase